MAKAFVGVLGAVSLAVAIAGAAVHAGFVSFAADEPHHEVVTKLIGWARDRAIARAATAIVVPRDLEDRERLRRAAGNYDAMCAQCHLAPGLEQTEIRMGLYPAAPAFAGSAAASARTSGSAERFWIIKHGIKGSGMPAWGKAGVDDDAIWDLTALVAALPRMDSDAYRALLDTGEGHSHVGVPRADERGHGPGRLHDAGKRAKPAHGAVGHSH